MNTNPKWAVCPNPDRINSSDTPKLFRSEASAKRFLNSEAPLPWLVGLNREARRAGLIKWKSEREEAIAKVKRGEWRFIPINFAKHKNSTHGWCDPVPIVDILQGAPCDHSFR